MKKVRMFATTAILAVIVIIGTTFVGCGFAEDLRCNTESDCATGRKCRLSQNGRGFCFIPLLQGEIGKEKIDEKNNDAGVPEIISEDTEKTPEETDLCANAPTGSCKVDGQSGECAKGTWECTDPKAGPKCKQTTQPANEICDGKDNDCNGQVDDGLKKLECGVGECKITVESCKDGKSQKCEPPSGSPEICDGKDNDCNGQVDDGLNETITCGKGPCLNTVQKCQNGKVTECKPKDVATTEICDNKDNDCDGQVDEDVKDCCTPGEKRKCTGKDIGICKPGQQTCKPNKSWGECVGKVEPKTEVCNGLDDDCNGTDDDGLNKMVSCGDGECKVTIQTCQGGIPKTCQPDMSKKSKEVCDGKDNDCNGQVDDGFKQLECGKGECKNVVDFCIAGKEQKCEPLKSSTEVCDGKDNDCDGQIDNSIGQISCGVGVCKKTIDKCVGGKEQTCQPDTSKKTTEVCDGKDNDCDGTPDNNIDPKSLETDINNCGACGNKCQAKNATANCKASKCEYVCDQGFRNVDGDWKTGCVKRNAGIDPKKMNFYYTFESGPKSSLADQSGNNHSGTLFGSVILANGIFGKAHCFSGASRWKVDATTKTKSTKTVSLWVKSTDVKDHFAAFYAVDNRPALTQRKGNWFFIYDSNNNFTVDGTAAQKDTWTLLTTTYASNQACAYINGSLVKCVSTTQTFGGTISIGGDPGTSTNIPDRYFRGCVDEVWGSPNTWSAKEIKTYYESSKP